jgi:hypothetical protein
LGAENVRLDQQDRVEVLIEVMDGTQVSLGDVPAAGHDGGSGQAHVGTSATRRPGVLAVEPGEEPGSHVLDLVDPASQGQHLDEGLVDVDAKRGHVGGEPASPAEGRLGGGEGPEPE